MSTFRQMLEIVENTCKPFIGKVNHNAYKHLNYRVETALEQAGVVLPSEVRFEKYGCRIVVDITGLGQKILLDCHIEFKPDRRSKEPISSTHRVLGITVTPGIKEEFFDSEIGDIVQMIAYSIKKDVHARILDSIKRLEKDLEEHKKDAARLEKDLKDSKWDRDVFVPNM